MHGYSRRAPRILLPNGAKACSRVESARREVLSRELIFRLNHPQFGPPVRRFGEPAKVPDVSDQLFPQDRVRTIR